MNPYKKKNLLWWLIMVFSFTIPLSSYLNVRLLILTLVVSFLLIRSLKEQWDFFFKSSWDILIYLAVLIAGVFYSSSVETAWKVLETNFCFLAIPLIISQIKNLKGEKINNIFWSFVLGLLIVSFICLIKALILYRKSGDEQVFFSYQFTDVVNSHPTYLAYYFIFALTFGLYLLYYNITKVSPLLMAIVLAFLFLMLMLTGGQTSFISMLFVFFFFILKFLVEKRSIIRSLTFALVCSMILCMFLVSRFEHTNRDLVQTDSWERFVLWEAAMNATPDIIWGVGTGDYKNILNEYYKTHNLIQFAGDSYNSHNQFIQILLTNGLLGLISVIVLICRPIYLSVKNHNILGVLVFFPFLIYGMTEVFLGRYQGIAFFALLHQVFISHYSSLKPSVEHLKGV